MSNLPRNLLVKIFRYVKRIQTLVSTYSKQLFIFNVDKVKTIMIKEIKQHKRSTYLAEIIRYFSPLHNSIDYGNYWITLSYNYGHHLFLYYTVSNFRFLIVKNQYSWHILYSTHILIHVPLPLVTCLNCQ